MGSENALKRRFFILAYLRSLAQQYTSTITFGVQIAQIKTVFQSSFKSALLDINFVYLIEKGYVAPMMGGMPVDKEKLFYNSLNNYQVKITAEGIDFLEFQEQEGKKTKKEEAKSVVQQISAQVANVSGLGDVYASVNIENAFTQIYAQILKEEGVKPEEKEDIKDKVKQLEEAVKVNEFKKAIDIISWIKEKAKFLNPIISNVVAELLKKWICGI